MVAIQTHTSQLARTPQVMPKHDVSSLEARVLDSPGRSPRWHLAENRDKVAVPVGLEDGNRRRLGFRVDRSHAGPRISLLDKSGALLSRRGRGDPPWISMNAWLARYIQPFAGDNFGMVEYKSVTISSPLGLSRSAAD